MRSHNIIKPDFLIIGAQRSGTTWLWNMLQQHPGTDLRLKKEIHFFGSAELYSNGKDWYHGHFSHLDASKIIGKASTTYFYDYVPYWHNDTNQLQHDDSLPTIPELITNEIPDVKIILILRDPVQRAVSAYNFNIGKGRISPFSKLRNIVVTHPKMRILEYGYYTRYLELWKKFVPPERMRVYVFEDDIQRSQEQTLQNVYRFLGLAPTFQPMNPEQARHKSTGWARFAINYYAGPLSKKLTHRWPISAALDSCDLCLQPWIPQERDFACLRARYLPEKSALEELLGRKLACWRYGLSSS